jgi:hypothetical protein
MQAIFDSNRSLSPEQFNTLKSTYIFVKAVTAHLETRNLFLTDAEISKLMQALGHECADRLLDDFPSLLEWRSLGDGQ